MAGCLEPGMCSRLVIILSASSQPYPPRRDRMPDGSPTWLDFTAPASGVQRTRRAAVSPMAFMQGISIARDVQDARTRRPNHRAPREGRGMETGRGLAGWNTRQRIPSSIKGKIFQA